MNKSGFVTTSKPKTNYISNYVQGTPGQNPNDHSYRNENKSKWVGGTFRPGQYSRKRY